MDKGAKLAACEVRKEHFQKHWQVQTFESVGSAPGYCCYSLFCSWCASYQLRKRAIYNDMSRYICCAGYLPCSGRCGEQKCPAFCLCMEVFCCFPQSVASTRWIIQDEQHLQNTKCDNCIIGTTIALQYLSCIFSCIAMCVQNDGVRQAAYILDLIADLLWASVCACMQTQHKIQLDARDKDPSLVQAPSPFMAPVQQTMGVPAYAPQQGGQPPQHGGYPPQQGGYPSQQGGYPAPPSGYPAPPPSGYPPPPSGYPMAQR